jgi:hypothetical protein
VQQRGVDGLEAGKSVIVPGVSNRVGAAGNRLIPAPAAAMVARSHAELKRR